VWPYQIIEQTSPWTYLIKNIIKGTQKEVHIDHLRFYKDSKLDVTLSLKEQMAFADVGYEVNKFVGVHKFVDGWKLKVNWRGFDSHDDTWELIATLLEDIPDKVQEYINKNKNDKLIKKMKREMKMD
jgi:hypothetical protein